MRACKHKNLLWKPHEFTEKNATILLIANDPVHVFACGRVKEAKPLS